MHQTTPARDERGASGVEYGLLISGIFIALTAAVYGFGGAFEELSNDNCDGVVGAIENADACR